MHPGEIQVSLYNVDTEETIDCRVSATKAGLAYQPLTSAKLKSLWSFKSASKCEVQKVSNIPQYMGPK